MSTNYYIRKQMSKDQEHTLISMVKNQEIEQLKEYLNTDFELIHIGKRATGWEFHWNFNAGQYYKSGNELINLLKSDEYIILDEYYRQYTFEKFWEEILPWIKTNEDDDLIDLEQYYKLDKSEYIYYEKPDHIKKYKELYNVDVNKHGEFHSDGLRFSIGDFR